MELPDYDLVQLNDAAEAAVAFQNKNAKTLVEIAGQIGCHPAQLRLPINDREMADLAQAQAAPHAKILNQWRHIHLPALRDVIAPAAVAWRLREHMLYLSVQESTEAGADGRPSTLDDVYAIARDALFHLRRVGYSFSGDLIPLDATNHKARIVELINRCESWSSYDTICLFRPQRFRKTSQLDAINQLSPRERQFLRCLSDAPQHPLDLGLEYSMEHPLSRQTADRYLKKFRELRLVRPTGRGERDGWIITSFGKHVRDCLNSDNHKRLADKKLDAFMRRAHSVHFNIGSSPPRTFVLEH